MVMYMSLVLSTDGRQRMVDASLIINNYTTEHFILNASTKMQTSPPAYSSDVQRLCINTDVDTSIQNTIISKTPDIRLRGDTFSCIVDL